MTSNDYIGLDIHKKTISFCAKAQDGTILDQGTIVARRDTLLAWAKARPRPWIGAMCRWRRWKRRCLPGGFTIF